MGVFKEEKRTFFKIYYLVFSSVQFSSVQLLSRFQLFATPWTAAHQASLSIINSQSLLKLISIQPSHPVIPFSSCLQSFTASGSFPVSQFFPSGGQSIGASALASILPMNIQGSVPLGLTGLPCCPRDSPESSPVPQC